MVIVVGSVLLGGLLAAAPDPPPDAAAMSAPAAAAATNASAEAGSTRPLGFGVGAQTEFLPPASGLSGVLLAYDARHVQFEGSMTIGVFQQGSNALGQANVYGASLRIYVPVHRRPHADFGLGVGGGAVFLKTPGQEVEVEELVTTGARVRIFVAPNACISGTVGAAALLRSGGSALLVGARPLGSAGFIYYFD